jgi:hypothetical protein
MSEPRTATGALRQDESDRAAVLRAVGLAPQFSWQRGWHIVWDAGSWLVLATDDPARLTQAQLVSAGSAAQLLVLAREAQGRATTVELLPDGEPGCVVALRDAGASPARRAQALLTGAVAPAGRPMEPSDVRHLNLAAEAFGCELLWQDASSPRQLTPGLRRVHATSDRRPLTTLVTHGDGRRDWLQAGRAAAQCALVARDLGLTLTFGVHPFNGWASREEIRQLWRLSGWPQLQFTLDAAPQADEVTPPAGAASVPTPRQA